MASFLRNARRMRIVPALGMCAALALTTTGCSPLLGAPGDGAGTGSSDGGSGGSTSSGGDMLSGSSGGGDGSADGGSSTGGLFAGCSKSAGCVADCSPPANDPIATGNKDYDLYDGCILAACQAAGLTETWMAQMLKAQARE